MRNSIEATQAIFSRPKAVGESQRLGRANSPGTITPQGAYPAKDAITHTHMLLHRRELLATAAWFMAGATVAQASVISGHLPWHPEAGNPPVPVRLGPWLFFTLDEAAAVEALADRIIPSDPQTPGGKDCGCAVYLDRQLAGPYGHGEGDYNRGPFLPAAKNFDIQSQDGPAVTYRKALAALDRYCRARHGGKSFAQLTDDEKDKIIAGVESGEARLEGVDGRVFIDHLIKDVQEGFIATWPPGR
jgi:gluconate 2-dehydrogenase gamma chain